MKPTQEKMLTMVDAWTITYQREDAIKTAQAIRDLIERVGEWKEFLGEIEVEYLSPVERQIRDFGEEGE